MVGWRASLSTTRSAPPLPLPRQNPQESGHNLRNNNERIASYVRSSSLYLPISLSRARRKCPMEKRFVRKEYPRDEGLFERGRFSRGGDVTRDGNPSNHEDSGSFQNAHNALCRVARRYVMHPVCLPAEYHLLSLFLPYPKSEQALVTLARASGQKERKRWRGRKHPVKEKRTQRDDEQAELPSSFFLSSLLSPLPSPEIHTSASPLSPTRVISSNCGCGYRIDATRRANALCNSNKREI